MIWPHSNRITWLRRFGDPSRCEWGVMQGFRTFGRSGIAASLVLALTIGDRAIAGPALLFDAKDGRVLYAEDHDNVWHPASLTKIMTAYMTFEAIKAGKLTMQSRISASEVSVQQPPSKVGLPVGATMTVELALQALIIKSANDVAVMLAEAIGGNVDDFAVMMNATAKRLGMTHSYFVNPHGLPAPEQVTTARDLATLSLAVLRDFPDYGALWSQADMRIGRRKLRTHNGLLKTYDGADGLKTGFICDSGYNVVATATRDGRRVVAVVLGSASGASRTIRAAELLEHGFQTAAWRDALQQPHTIKTLPVPTDAKSTATVVRNELLNRSCNGGRRVKPANAVAKVKQQRQDLAKKAAVGASPAKAGQTVAAPTPAPATKTAAPAGPVPAAKAAN
jgi:D-alanyl-D-alanine carboxypeptidase